MDNSIKKTWHGLTGAQVREIIRKTEQKAEDAINTVNTVVQPDSSGELKIKSEYLPSYIDDIVEGYYNAHNFYYDEKYTDQIEPDKGKIYVDLTDDKKVSYRYSGSKYIEIVNGDEIQKRLDNLILIDKGDYSIESIITSLYLESQKQLESINNHSSELDSLNKKIGEKKEQLASSGKTGDLFNLTADFTDQKTKITYPKGMYIYTGTEWHRIGGLL